MPGVIRVALIGKFGGDSDVVTRHYIHYSGTAPTAAQLNTFATSVATAWATNVKALAETSYTLLSVACEDLTSSTAAVGSALSGVAGTNAGGNLPAEACVVVSYSIARRYRGGHPRGYWAIGAQSNITASLEWDPTWLGTVTTDLNAYFAALIAAGWAAAGTLTQVNVSFYSGFTPVRNPITGRYRNVPNLRGAPVVDTITALTPRARVGSQRRRSV